MDGNLSSILTGFTSEAAAKAGFTTRLCAYLGVRYALPVSTGTAALEVALRGLDLRRGDQVLVPDISFIATATAVANCGLVPVYADVSPAYFGLTLSALRRRLTPAVKAVILVHLAGFMNREINDIAVYCREHGLALVEDCAQAFGCSAQGKMAGAFGNAGTFSFHSSKIINAGEGGLLVTDSEALAAECEAITDWGMTSRRPARTLDLASSNFRLSAIQCYVLTRQIEAIGEIIAARHARCAELEAACRKAGVTSCLPAPADGVADCPFFFPVRSSRKINAIEPQPESPLHRSSIVPAILRRFHPDLLSAYREANPAGVCGSFRSNRVIEETDFINIHYTGHLPAESVMRAYGGPVP